MKRDWVTIAEAAEITGRAKETLILLVQQKRIPAYKSGSTWLLYRPAVEDYAAFVRATDGMLPTAATKAVNGPLAFLGHGRTVKWSRKMRYWGAWWEDEETVRLLEERTRLENLLEELRLEDGATSATRSAVPKPGEKDGTKSKGHPNRTKVARTWATKAQNGALPVWLQDWLQSPHVERDKEALWVIGATGTARRRDASRQIAHELGTKPNSGVVTRVFNRLVNAGMLEVIEARSEFGGPKTWHLIRLSQRGQEAFRLLFGQDPAPSQTSLLLERHGDPDKVLLVLAAADLFADARWEVDIFPGAMYLVPDGARYVPDLVIMNPQEQFLVKCDLLIPVEQEWRLFYRASVGRMVAVVPDQRAFSVVRDAVLAWMEAWREREFVLRVTVLEEASPNYLFQYTVTGPVEGN